MSKVYKPVKKLRFTIRKLRFSDLYPYFSAETVGQTNPQTRLTLSLSSSRFDKLTAEEVHSDCIAFSQLLKIKKCNYDSIQEGTASSALVDDVVMVLFDNFSTDPILISNLQSKARKVIATPEKLAELLFLNGFSVKSKNSDELEVSYVRFSSSASMTRDGSILFVNQKYEPELSERVTLRLEKDGCLSWAESLIPSKWDAYKGLCLSDGYALEWLKQMNPELNSEETQLPELSEETVAVIKDMTWEKYGKWLDSKVRMLRFKIGTSDKEKNLIELEGTPDEVTPEKKRGQTHRRRGNN